MKLYFDLGSPYAYLAAERLAGREVQFEPVLAGAIFGFRGRGSWGLTDEREANMREVERRAAELGLPPVAWPPGWPNNTLHAMRAALAAPDVRAFAMAAFRRAFVDGADLSDPAALPPHGEITQAVKEELRARTSAAWERGVVGVPCVEVDGAVIYGDDQLHTLVAP